MTNEKRSFVGFAALASLGIVGVLGQAALLHNGLVHSYPFKLMGMPTADFYSSVGEVGYYIAVTTALISIVLTLRLPRFLTGVVPVAVCPIVYWLVFEFAHIIQGFSREQMMERNFDGYTGNLARYEFGFEVLTLVFFGVVIGSVAGVVVTKVASIGRGDLP